MIRNIIFDWSGTLVDDLPAVLKASNYVLTQAGKPAMSLSQFRAEFKLPFTHFYDRHVPEISIEQLEEWFHAEFRRSQDSVLELPHAREFLEFCHAKKVRMFLLSSMHPEHFATQCRVLGLNAFLEKAYTGVWNKQEQIHQILRDNKLKPDETMFIGDMEHDIATAHHGGIHSCAVLTGYNTLEQLRAAKPDLIVEHLSELRHVLEKNNFQLQPHSSQKDTLAPQSTVGGLIYNHKGEVLMIRTHKWSNKWGIPGGKIKWGESSEAALRREILEETGLRITDIRFVLVQDCVHSKEFYRDAHFVLLNYICRVSGKSDVKLNHEAQEFVWLSPRAAKKLKLNRPTKILLDAAIKLRRKK